MILILKAKHGDYPVYARNEAECYRAYLHLFNLMDKWGCYNNLDGDQVTWYNQVKNLHCPIAVEQLLNYRSHAGYEYETIEEIEPVTP